MMDVEFYWNRVFAGFAAKLPNGEPQFPTLKYVFPSYFLCRLVMPLQRDFLVS
jgi:hypothetical protein